MQRQERPRNPVAMLLGSLVVVVVVASVIGTLAATGRFSGGRVGAGGGVLGSPVAISTLHAASLLCPSSAAFSPDGAELAIIGSSNSCHSHPYDMLSFNPHVLALFDAHLGTLQRTIQLDPLVGYDQYAPRAAERIRAVRYVGLGWAPQGKRLAVAYATFDSASDTSFDHVMDSGLLLVDTTTGAPVVSSGNAGFFTAPTGGYSGYPVWNLTQHVASPPFAPAAGLTYTWMTNGAVRAIVPLDGRDTLSHLPVSAGAKYPIGDPASDSNFTIWQPGVLLGASLAGVGNGRDAFVTAFPSWSIDGTFATMLLAGVAIPGAPVGQSASETAASGTPPVFPQPMVMPRVPARDAALASVATNLAASDWALVAWNPAGTLLASIDCGDPHGPSLEVRETSTGNVVGTAQVALPAGEHGCRDFNAPEDLGDYPNSEMTLRWSPDGRVLLVSDERAATIELWQVQAEQASGQ